MAQDNSQKSLGDETSGVVMDAIAADKREGLRMAVKARWIALSIIAVFVLYLNPGWEAIYYEVILLGFAAHRLGPVQARPGRLLAAGTVPHVLRPSPDDLRPGGPQSAV